MFRHDQARRGFPRFDNYRRYDSGSDHTGSNSMRYGGHRPKPNLHDQFENASGKESLTEDQGYQTAATSHSKTTIENEHSSPKTYSEQITLFKGVLNSDFTHYR